MHTAITLLKKILPALVAAIFLLFLNPGVITAMIVSVAGPARRARAVALTIIVIHLVGDVPSPFLIGVISDIWGLTLGVAATLAALALAVLLILSARPYLLADLRQAGELIDAGGSLERSRPGAES